MDEQQKYDGCGEREIRAASDFVVYLWSIGISRAGGTEILLELLLRDIMPSKDCSKRGFGRDPQTY